MQKLEADPSKNPRKHEKLQIRANKLRGRLEELRVQVVSEVLQRVVCSGQTSFLFAHLNEQQRVFVLKRFTPTERSQLLGCVREDDLFHILIDSQRSHRKFLLKQMDDGQKEAVLNMNRAHLENRTRGGIDVEDGREQDWQERWMRWRAGRANLEGVLTSLRDRFGNLVPQKLIDGALQRENELNLFIRRRQEHMERLSKDTNKNGNGVSSYNKCS